MRPLCFVSLNRIMSSSEENFAVAAACHIRTDAADGKDESGFVTLDISDGCMCRTALVEPFVLNDSADTLTEFMLRLLLSACTASHQLASRTSEPTLHCGTSDCDESSEFA